MSRHDPFIDHLTQVPLFSACSRNDLRSIAKRAKDVQVAAGTTLVTEGDDGDEFFVIVEGTASVRRQGRKVTSLGPGSGFGELALLATALRNATIVADTDMELVVVGRRDFAVMLDEIPGFARKMLRGTAARLREADRRAIQ